MRPDKVTVEVLARRVQPDLYEDVPMTPEVKELLHRYTLTDQLREQADFLDNEGIELPYSNDLYINCTAYYSHEEKKEMQVANLYDSMIHTERSKKNLARVVQAARRSGYKVEKEYDDDYFRVIVTTKSGCKIRFSVTRQAVCKRVVVGKEYVPAQDGYYKDKVEYDCERIALTRLDVEA